MYQHATRSQLTCPELLNMPVLLHTWNHIFIVDITSLYILQLCISSVTKMHSRVPNRSTHALRPVHGMLLSQEWFIYRVWMCTEMADGIASTNVLLFNRQMTCTFTDPCPPYGWRDDQRVHVYHIDYMLFDYVIYTIRKSPHAYGVLLKGNFACDAQCTMPLVA